MLDLNLFLLEIVDSLTVPILATGYQPIARFNFKLLKKNSPLNRSILK